MIIFILIGIPITLFLFSVFNDNSIEHYTTNTFKPEVINKEISGKVYNVWIQHDIISNYIKGMNIHAQFAIYNAQNKPCNISSYFFYDTGIRLNDFDGMFTSTEGQVAVGNSFIPQYINSNFNDFILFMPYNQLHMGTGIYRLNLIVTLAQENGTLISTSKPVEFIFNQY